MPEARHGTAGGVLLAGSEPTPEEHLVEVVLRSGEPHLDVTARGRVVRCVHCGSVMAVVVHGGGRYWLGVSGMTWLEIPDPAAA